MLGPFVQQKDLTELQTRAAGSLREAAEDVTAWAPDLRQRVAAGDCQWGRGADLPLSKS